METFAARLRGLGIGNAILAASLGAGCLFRLIPPMRTDFPLHDGGMFYVMIEAIRREQAPADDEEAIHLDRDRLLGDRLEDESPARLVPHAQARPFSQI